MNTKTKLFIALAAGRATCGFCTLTGILFLVWLAEALGKTGLSLSETAGTIGMAILMTVFTKEEVLKATAEIPYKILVVNSATFLLDALVILLLGDVWPYIVLISGVISVMCDKTYLQSRKVLFNRVYHGDELTLIGNRLDVINIAAALGGSTLAIVVPATTTNLALVIIIADVVLTISNYYQIKYLLVLQDDGDVFRARIAAQRTAYREKLLNGDE